MRSPLERIYYNGETFNREHAMAKNTQHPILNYLHRLLGAHVHGGVGDADLLRRFIAERDEAAFELLLWRHAAMVLHVCRQVLGDAEAADDAFQATFLVFVRKAGSIGRRESLGSWLYRVAYRIALKARAQTKKRAAEPVELDRLAAPAETDDAEQRELRRILCEEVNRLPAKYRAPIVACFFEGKTHEEAAHQLGWPRGTVAGRLARARDLLRRRLLRRGLTFTMAAFLSALSVRTGQAALASLVDSLIETARQLAAGQAIRSVASPSIAALTEGVLHAMVWTKIKYGVVVLLLASIGGAGMTLLATQEQNEAKTKGQPQYHQPLAQAPQPMPPGGGGDSPSAGGGVAAKEEEEPEPEYEPPPAKSPEEAAKLAHNMALSRLNLRKLALAMINYADVYGHLPQAATVGRDGKALLSWRVELLPFLEEQALYNQFRRDEPWDSPHNKKLLSKMPKVFAPPGIETRRPYSTFYQVFVSAASSDNKAPGSGPAPAMPGMVPGGPGGMPGGPPGMRPMAPPGRNPPGMPGGGMQMPAGGPGMAPPGAPGGMPGQVSDATAAFVKGEQTRIPASFPDGTSNTILIVEAGNPVPWTKPEDLRYAEDEPLPELGGIFPDVFHAVAADGKVHTLRSKYNAQQLRRAITANDGEVLNWAKIEARLHRRAGGEGSSAQVWQRKNEELRKELTQLREQVRLLKEEQEVEREMAGEDPRISALKEDHTRMQAELKKLHAEVEALKKDIRRPR
jgi:RNA polymerase sigma factor (sigma-70 family)